jgi:hypothetical protein
MPGFYQSGPLTGNQESLRIMACFHDSQYVAANGARRRFYQHINLVLE